MKFLRRPKLSRQRLRSDEQALPTSFAYHARRAEQDVNTGRQLERQTTTPKVRLHVRRRRLRRAGLVILSFILIVAAFDLLSLSGKAQIDVLSAAHSNNLLRSTTTYQAAADRLLGDSIWNRNKITIDTNGLSQQLTEEFPELASVSVSWPLFGHQPIVYVQPITPALILAASNGAFVLDTNGKAILGANTSAALSHTDLPMVTDSSNLQASLGKQALPTNEVSFIQTVVAQLAAKHIGIASMTLPPASDELDVHLTGVTYFVKFNLANTDARQQVGTFLATQAQLKGQNITPGQYIDVRVDGRAYYQ